MVEVVNKKVLVRMLKLLMHVQQIKTVTLVFGIKQHLNVDNNNAQTLQNYLILDVPLKKKIVLLV